MVLMNFPSRLTKQVECIIKRRTIYGGSHVIYPSSKWLREGTIDGNRDEGFIYPAVVGEGLGEVGEEVCEEHNLCNLHKLQRCGSVHMFTLRQTLQQYLFGVTHVRNDGDARRDLIHFSMQSKGLAPKLVAFAKHITTLNHPLNPIKSRLMDSVYFATRWLYMGISSSLNDRPVVILPTSTHYTRQLQRYYGIIACMALGVTPIQIGADIHGNPYTFERMPHVLPLHDRHGNHLLACLHSTDEHHDVYKQLRYMHNGLGIHQQFPELIFIVELQEYFRRKKTQLELGMQVDQQYMLEYVDMVALDGGEMLQKQISYNRVIYVPDEGAIRLSNPLHDEVFGLPRVAMAEDGGPVLIVRVDKNGSKVFPWQPNASRDECVVTSLETGEAHDSESFLADQRFVEEEMGAGHAVVCSEEVDVFKAIYHPRHLEEIFNESNI